MLFAMQAHPQVEAEVQPTSAPGPFTAANTPVMLLKDAADIVGDLVNPGMSSEIEPAPMIADLPPAPAELPLPVMERLVQFDAPSVPKAKRSRKSKGFAERIPRTKRWTSKPSRFMPDQLQQPLLTTDASPPSLALGERGSESMFHRQPAQRHGQHQSSGLWQKLGSGLAAIWRWLCQSGGKLRQLCKKLLSTLGLREEEAQKLLAAQQAEEYEVLAVSPHNTLQPLGPGPFPVLPLQTGLLTAQPPWPVRSGTQTCRPRPLQEQPSGVQPLGQLGGRLWRP